MNSPLNAAVISLLFLLLLVPCVGAQDGPVTLTSKDGKSLQVYLKMSTGTKVTFENLSNKRAYTLDLDKLDEASQERVKKWKEAGGGASVGYEIKFVSGKRNGRSPYEYSDGRRLKLKPEVTITNTDRGARTKAATLTVLIMGRPVLDRSSYTVLGREDHPLAVMAPLEKRVFKLRSITTEYDNKGYSKYGSSYLGYAVLIHNDDSQVIVSKSSPTSFAKNFGGMLLNLKKGRRYDKKLDAKKSSSRSLCM
jgi:hypothetical protein